MNTITRRHYPASRLPSDLRLGIDPGVQVTVTIEIEDAGEEHPLSLDDILALHRSPGRTIDQIDLELDKDRDEWRR